MDVEVEWVVVDTVALLEAGPVLTCAVTTAARPMLRRAKNFILVVVRTGAISTSVRYTEEFAKRA